MDGRLAFDVEMEKMIQLMLDRGIVRYEDAERVFKRHFLLHALRRHGGNVSRTAIELGVHRNLIHRQALTLGLPGKKARCATG
jgi:DNA-binding NtrC family response regulator